MTTMIMRTTVSARAMLPGVALFLLLLNCISAKADDELTPIESQDLEPAATVEEVIAEGEAIRINDSTNENPDAGRMAEKKRLEKLETDTPSLDLNLYGSVRLHAINTFNLEDLGTSHELGDGASRGGLSGRWNVAHGWDLFGRVETGFDILDTFTSKGQAEDENQLRLANIGLEGEEFFLKYGKSWSVYYTVAGEADRFAIFGGNATGTYNAGTDGGATGTGRADDALQTMVYIDPKGWQSIKPFNLNLQYATGQPIPEVRGQKYDYSWSASAWLESTSNLGVGLAYLHAAVENRESPEVVAAGIDGNATAASIALKTYGDKWLASLILAKLNNIETTELNQYFNGEGAELFVQWQFANDFWLVGGGNWLIPDEDNPLVGDYSVKYGVLGLHYSIDSFNRMLYVEWKDDHGRLSNGLQRKNEFTLGIRWDLGYQ